MLDHAKRLPTSLRWTASPRERLRRDYGVTRAAECGLLTKRSLTIQYQRHCHGDNQRWPVAADRARAATPISRSGSSGEVQELVSHLYQRNRKRPARRVSALHPLFSVGEGKCSSLGGLIALFALLAHHFFSCSVTGKPLASCHHPRGCDKNARSHRGEM